MPTVDVHHAVHRLAARATTRTEADVQADLYLVLTSGSLALDVGDVVRLEQQIGDGTRRRLDVEIGHCVIEVKKDLRPTAIREDAEVQLAGYVQTQSRSLNARYVGILTDGTSWYLYRLVDGALIKTAELVLSEQSPDVERLLVWLESLLATQDHIVPAPDEIDRRLGASSPAHALDHGSLLALYREAGKIPEVGLKRDLWAKLLRTAFGTAFTDDEHLFIDHTLLVLTAEVIAHAVVGFDISATGSLSATSLARGTEFANAQIFGVVEADFFEWVLEVPGGPAFLTDLAHRMARFDWSHVDHDVLKTLYESIISTDDRASLGEYYTPDWLADRIIAAAVPEPLTTRVLDPACGSGTFLFHAARAYLAAADAAGTPNGEAVLALTQHVYGLDVHPVAVTLARVTYLLAIGQTRLAAADRGPIAVPVYLGDALQWEQRRDLLSAEARITISTAGTDLVEGGGTLFGDDLVFPSSILHDAGDFDRLVTAMADKALDESTRRSADLIAPTLRQFGVHEEDVPVLTETFATMRRLHGTGRDHIWGYYVRNLIRPLWLADPEHRVDVLLGNPPWLRYSKMTAAMQSRYKSLAKDRGLLSGGLGASGRDLSTLFAVRAVEHYLKPGGSFSFVMPQGTLTRKPHHGFRSGRWTSKAGQLAVAFAKSWDLAQVTTGLPMVSCVIHGALGASPKVMPTTTSVWTGKLKHANVAWQEAEAKITISEGTVTALDAGTVQCFPVQEALPPGRSPRAAGAAVRCPRERRTARCGRRPAPCCVASHDVGEEAVERRAIAAWHCRATVCARRAPRRDRPPVPCAYSAQGRPAGHELGHTYRDGDRGALGSRGLVARRRGHVGRAQVEVRRQRLAGPHRLPRPARCPTPRSRAPCRLHQGREHARERTAGGGAGPSGHRPQALLGGRERRG